MRVDGQEGSSNDVAGVDQRGDGPARAGEGALVDDRIFRGCEIPAIVAGDVPAASGEPGAQPVGEPGSRAALFLQEPDVGIDRLEDSLKVRRSLKVEDARVLDVVGGEANGVDPWPIDIDGPGWGDLPCIDGVGKASRLVGKQIPSPLELEMTMEIRRSSESRAIASRAMQNSKISDVTVGALRMEMLACLSPRLPFSLCRVPDRQPKHHSSSAPTP